jgi:serralysin
MAILATSFESSDHMAAAEAPVAGAAGPGEVTDYTALLYYEQNDSLRWNGMTDVGTPVVITYSFTESIDLPPASSDPFGATAYWAYDTAQRDLFREVAGKYEAISGVIFVEIEGESMINVFGSTGGFAGGWANVAQSTSTTTSRGTFTNNYSDMDQGDYGYQVNLHELGHALGLQHPHEGIYTLAPNLDTQANSVMTYNVEYPYATELGVFDVQAMQDIYGTADSVAGWTVSADVNDMVTITATGRSETIIGTDQDTVVMALGGRDVVFGREGNDYLNGGQHRDTVYGGLGQDTIYGGGGFDVLYGDTNASAYSGNSTSKDLIYGGGGADTIYGGNGNDIIFGNGRNDILDGGYGNDSLKGGGGNDTLYGGNGADELIGHGGSDVFVFTTADAYSTDVIRDFTIGDDVIDVSDLGFTSLSQLSQNVLEGDTFLSYSNWFEVELLKFTGTLSTSDFIFA